jgi:hypothetical protein
MSNIEEMEKEKHFLCSLIKGKEVWENWNEFNQIYNFMGDCINSLKDLHEENCKLWKEIAKLRGER